MYKHPKADLHLQYKKTLEMAAIVSLLMLISTMLVFKRFESNISFKSLDIPAIQVEDIPITRTIKKVEVPRKPTIPVADPTIDMAKDIDIPDIDDMPALINAIPPPPPPDTEGRVPFWKVEIQPVLIGGENAIAKYILENDLFPRMAREAGISGKALIEFVVGTDGIPRELNLKQEIPVGLGFGEAGIEVMKHMVFTPGMQRDRKVAVVMSQKITFTIE